MTQTRFAVWDTEPVPLTEGVVVTQDGLTPTERRENRFQPNGRLRFATVGDRMSRLALSRGDEVTEPGERKGREPAEVKGTSWLEGCSSADTRLVDTMGSTIDCNGFLQTLDIAYNFHQGLRLRPDDIWLLISMGFSMHVNRDPERYRHLLVDFQGKKELEIWNDKVKPGRGCANDWVRAGVLDQFSEKIRDHIGEDLHGTLVADFSTTTPVDRAVSEIVLMDTTKAYFNYVAYGMCGIPYVVLEGTLQDWEAIRQRVEPFSKFGLGWWLEDLRCVLDEFVAAKRGEANVGFWKRMYRGEHAEEDYHQAGATYVSGWIHVLFPYLMNKRPNEPRREPPSAQWRRSAPEAAYALEPGLVCAACGSSGAEAEGAAGAGEWWCRQCWRAHDLRRWFGHRVDHFRMPTGFRSVPFKWVCSGTYDCLFLAGFVGCAPATDAHEVAPQLAYCVLNKGLHDESDGANGRSAGA